MITYFKVTKVVILIVVHHIVLFHISSISIISILRVREDQPVLVLVVSLRGRLIVLLCVFVGVAIKG